METYKTSQGVLEKTEAPVRAVQRNSEIDRASLLIPVSVMGWSDLELEHGRALACIVSNVQ